MANTNAPFGLRPVSMLDGSCFHGAIRKFYVPSTDATAIGIGDPVVLAGAADTDGVHATVTRMTTPGSDVMVGVMIGIEPLPTDLTLNYRKASTGMYIFCTVGQDVLYEIQEVSGGTALTAAAVGLNANVTMGTVDTVTGNGKTVLNNATEATTNSLDVQIIGLAPKIGNALGDSAIWHVRLNRCQYVNATTGIS